MRYSDEEKQIAQAFINCKIPERVKNNCFDLQFDSMELYEILFDFAYCVLNDTQPTPLFLWTINREYCYSLFPSLGNGFEERDFGDKASALCAIMRKHL
jgi:hypothetical protein